MASYVDILSDKQRENIALIVYACREIGITNEYAIGGILAIASKECNFIPKNETSYRNTSNERIRKVFGSKLGEISDEDLTKLKQDDKAFFDRIYGSRHGNGPDEGYLYRGRGMNGVTFKYGYIYWRDKTGIDIVSNPDLLNEPGTAAKVYAAYSVDGIEKLKAYGKLKEYNAEDINDFKDSEDAVMAFYHATAGVGYSVQYIKDMQHNNTLKGMQRALERVDDLVHYVNESGL